jgi:hypothetical protein
MGLIGYASGGSSGFGPSKMWNSLPFKGWKELSTWVEEFVDACGYRFDVLNARFISPAARAALLDPTITPTDSATQYLATATAAPSQAASTDTVLDVILYIVLGIGPADSNLSIAQKQALAQVGWSALRRKGTRQQLLNLASKISDGVTVGWSTPPNNFSIIVPDGAPDPGWGNWVQSSGTTSGVIRPWTLNAIRSTVKPISPDFGYLGVGFSQFRAGYSAAGETVFPTGARTSILSNEHFSSWSAGAPVGWTITGAATLTQSTSAPYINWEFTGSAAVFDLTAAGTGSSVGLSQSTSLVNNQLTQRCQIDYAYTNTQSVSVLSCQVTDSNPNGSTYYWNPTAATWSTTAYTIVMPPSSSARARYAFDIVPQAASSSTTVAGSNLITINVFAKSDGTPTTTTTYTVYRVGLYDKFSLSAEQAAAGERTSWYPLYDSQGWASASRSSSTATLLEPANAQRTAYKSTTSTGVAYPYHPAASGRGFQSNSAWTNLIKGSNVFNADWTLTNASRALNSAISPLVGETVATAPTLTATSTGAKIAQASIVTPTSKTYVGGVWVKKLSTDVNFTDVTIRGVSTSTKTQTYTLTQAQGWQLLPFTFTFSGTDLASLSLEIAWGAASSNGQIAVASSYLYDVTGKTGILYPPIVQTPAAATATLNATSCQAVTQTTNTNVLHPLLLRSLQSVVRGSLSLTIVPMFDAGSQPTGQTIFDLSQGAAQNRVVLRVTSGALELKRWDNAGNTWTASLTLSANLSPASGSMTWLRDTAINVRCLWDENTTMIGAGNGSALGTKPGSWAPSDTSVSKLFIGSDTAAANQFDGIIRAMEHVQLGAATT